jgi:predicted acetyltransferase
VLALACTWLAFSAPMSDLAIRAATPGDIRAVADLWTHAFPGGRTLVERMHALDRNAGYGGIDDTVVAHVEGRLAAALKMYRLTQHLAGAALPMMGLAAVAVAPWARRRGHGRTLCRWALEAARARGDVLSALYPFKPAFYRSLGWGTVGELHTYVFAPEALVPTTEQRTVRLADPEDEPAITACYDRVARASNGLIARTEGVWRQHLDGPGTHVFVYEDGPLNGYVRVRYGKARSPEQRPLFVDELIAETEAAYGALLGWLSRQRELWRRIRYDATPDEHFAHRLVDPRPPGFRGARRLWAQSARIIRGPMVRVLDVTAALERRRVWGAAPPVAFTLELRDPELPENGGPFRVEHDAGSVSVAPSRTAARNALRTDAPTFAQIYCGELGVLDARRLGCADVAGDAAALDALFRVGRRFRLLDEF